MSSPASRLEFNCVENYLLDRKLLSKSDIVDQEVTIVPVSRRNRSFKVVVKNSTSYLLKQGVGFQRSQSVGNEARVYRFLDSQIASAFRIPESVPKYYGYDDVHSLLIVECYPEAENFREYHSRINRFPRAIAGKLGKAIGKIHEIGSRYPSSEASVPWALSMLLLPHIDLLREVSASNIQLIKIVQKFAEFSELLGELRDSWTRTALIHGDLKWENCLVVSKNGSKSRALGIVDWELAGLGDPLWDVGCIFADYLAHWVFSMPVTPNSQPEELVRLARWPLEEMHPACRAFWNDYLGQVHRDREQAMIKSVRYAGGRLLQTAFEHLQGSNFLSGHAVCLLQLSLNMMKQPTEAATQLLGLERDRDGR